VFVAEKAGTWVESPVVGEVVNPLSVGLGLENVLVIETPLARDT